MSNQQRIKGVLDLVFLMDATGSMGSCIDALKASINLFIDTLTSPGANGTPLVGDWRAKVVGYRDFRTDGAKWIEDNAFVRDVAALRSQLAALKAEGGGDEPESLLDAVCQVVDAGATAAGSPEDPNKWRRGVMRFLVIFTDASFHPQMSTGGDWNDVQNKLMSNRIFINLFAPDMEQYNETFAVLDGSDYFAIPVPAGSSPQRALSDYVADQAVFQKTLKRMADSITGTIQNQDTFPV